MVDKQPENSIINPLASGPEIQNWIEISQRVIRSLPNIHAPASELYPLNQGVPGEALSYHQKAWLEKGLEMAALSRPAALLYFRHTPLFLKHLRAVHLASWGDRVLGLLRTEGEKPQAAMAFLEVAPAVVPYLSHYELQRWFATGQHVARQAPEMGPAYFSALPEGFLQLYMTERLSLYQLVFELANSDPEQALAFYQSSPQALGRLNSLVRVRVLDLLKRIASDRPETLIPFFNAFMTIFESLEYPVQDCLLRGEKRIRNLSLEASMTYLLKTEILLREIPDAFIGYFVDRGISVLSRSKPEGLGYFSLETTESWQEISNWKQAVLLDDHREVLNYFACALTGRDIHIRKPGEDPDDRDNPNRVYPTGDGCHIYLQPYAAGGKAARENFLCYKVAVAHQAGYMEWGIFHDPSFLEQADFESFSIKALAVDIFFILEDGRIDYLLKKEYQGLASDLDMVLATQLKKRPDPNDLPLQAAVLEIMLHLTCGFGIDRNIRDELKKHLRFLEQELSGFYESGPGLGEVFQKTERIYDYLVRLPGSETYCPLIPLTARGRVELEILKGRGPWPSPGDRIILDQSEEEARFQKSQQEQSHFYEKNRIQILRFMDDEEDIPFQGLFVKDADGLSGKSPRDETEEAESHRIKDHFHYPASEQKPSGPFYYDEWDYQAGTYRSRWCRLYEKDIQPVDSEVVRGVYENNQGLIQQVRRQFQQIRPAQLKMVRGLEWGQEFYWPALIQSVVERKAGVGPTERIFTRREKKLRKTAILFLIDMSASTDEQVPCRDRGIGQEKKVIEIEVESLVVMMEALDAFSDEYAIHGFSGYGREQVDFYRIKDFSDPYSEALKKRLGGIGPQKSTRMGPAIRHATQKMRKINSDQRLLILLSDGFPQDSDYGEDRSSKEYGLQDTMMALLEAGREGIQPFCITVDQAGNDYLKKMCDPASYLVIRDIYSLPETLPKIIAFLMLT